MWGGIFGLSYVENERWGGLTLTLLLSTFGIAFAFPLSILLALGRRSHLPLVRWLSIAYIELIRGVPLISVLFMASVMLPLFLPQGVSIDKLLRAQLAMILFAAAYLAEVVRGGLQAIPRQQEEAALALGLGYWQRAWYVTLPQALTHRVTAAGQYLYRLLQRHVAGRDHRSVRFSDHDQSLLERTGVDGFRRRSLPIRRLRLFLILLSDVALLPKAGAASSAGAGLASIAEI